ncbi:hypothetical protein A2957_00085 [Candidatus Roizmanbacteria bacterium RIFCSPLOWO2_01_FULL_38_11]|uniref:Uncharacterized protein n=1 Tax=Candidatus Roizmanbacteria bacterium RIFCSPLOWO2_01_FULL_38_11 TaxID=1802060 RepID=A0A1F7IMZ0_9BACT|nr:MAG: hypothetical protein A2957_00085 [Candidatus Roizmanbacteria bacterium RIFCSPLOWO2_01_FULL_38_11]
MNIQQANPITLAKLSLRTTPFTNTVWDVSLMKKFITPKWPYELYKGSLLNDFLSVFFSKVS